jgi:hypothetical protein
VVREDEEQWMFENESKVYQFMLGYIEQVVDDLTDDMMDKPPAPGANPPVWILGHLAIAPDWGLQSMGKPALCPELWHKQFGPGSDPAKIARPHPTKAELLAAIRRGHEAFTAAARQADPAAMSKPHAIPFLQGSPIKTVGETVTLLMTAHDSVHIGQLSLCRRLRGKPHLF